jgi:hypothetical protein
MNQELWRKVEEFDFDSPQSEYSFSIRLARENFWTESFTKLALVEYKKFMYLAATSGYMVSPSEIVDIVWHQHLIFTQSYQEFCKILGKQIEHIPSTHNKEEFEKFRKAKENTKEHYERNFGNQPKSVWEFSGMFESLNLEKAKFKIRSVLIAGILLTLALSIPFYYILKPIYVTIDNPIFLNSFALIVVFLLVFLELFNKNSLKKISLDFDKSSFVFDLQASELIYLKTRSLTEVVASRLNELLNMKVIDVDAKRTIEIVDRNFKTNIEQGQIKDVIDQAIRRSYPIITFESSRKPIFRNIPNAMDAFEKYLTKSKKFGSLFYTNFIIFSLLFLFSFTRIITGISRHKPVTLIVFATILLLVLASVILYRLLGRFLRETIPNMYKNDILTKNSIDENSQWNYFLFGKVALAFALAPLVINFENQQKETGGSCSSSCSNGNGGSGCASSCGGGSSCGSSCGGCGGGD